MSLTPKEKEELKRGLTHARNAFLWSMIALWPTAFLCYEAGLSQDECQAVGLIMTVIIMVLTNPGPPKPPVDKKDLRP